MRKYHYTGSSTPEVRITRIYPNVEGWVLAENLDHAERIIEKHGFYRESLTFYPKGRQFREEWKLEGAEWVDLPA